MEQVGLDQIVELGALANPDRHRKSPVGEVIVEHRIGDETRHADDPPAGQRLELRIDRIEVGNGVADAEGLADPRRNSGAGELLRQRRLALDQQAPHRLILVRVEVEGLRHGPIGRHAGVVAAQAGDRE